MNNVMNYPRNFRMRRFLNWFPLGLTYATFYMGRYNMHVANSTIREQFHFDKTEFGIVMTAGFWAYALSVIFNGPLADRIGGKKAILVGALGGALLNLIIGLLFLNQWHTQIITGLSLLYAVNCYFQSFGALSVVKVNSAWFHVRERGVFGGIFGSMISGGYWLAMGVGGWILATQPWYTVFLVPAFAMLAMFFVDLFLVQNTPEDAGHAVVETGTKADAMDHGKEVNLTFLMHKVFKDRVIVTLMAAEFCTGFVRQGLLAWFVPFLKEVHGVNPGSYWQEFAAAGITVGGIFGGILCGYLSDKIFHSRRPPVAFIYYLLQIVSIFLLGFSPNAGWAAFFIGFSCAWIFGVHGMLTGTASMDFGGKKATSTVAGMLDGVQYVAAGFTGFGLGYIIDHYGWSAWSYSLMPFSLIGAFLMLTIWNASSLKHDVGPAKPEPEPELKNALANS